MIILPDDLNGPQIRDLLDEHLRDMYSQSPPESVHALDLDRLRQPDISFWSAWHETGRLMGCGALKALDETHAEIKSMRTAHAFRRCGVGRAMLAHLVAQATGRGFRRLSLETGTQPGFAAARGLYESFGFETCGPFADYVEDPNSVFMTLRL